MKGSTRVALGALEFAGNVAGVPLAGTAAALVKEIVDFSEQTQIYKVRSHCVVHTSSSQTCQCRRNQNGWRTLALSYIILYKTCRRMANSLGMNFKRLLTSSLRMMRLAYITIAVLNSFQCPGKDS